MDAVSLPHPVHVSGWCFSSAGQRENPTERVAQVGAAEKGKEGEKAEKKGESNSGECKLHNIITANKWHFTHLAASSLFCRWKSGPTTAAEEIEAAEKDRELQGRLANGKREQFVVQWWDNWRRSATQSGGSKLFCHAIHSVIIFAQCPNAQRELQFI